MEKALNCGESNGKVIDFWEAGDTGIIFDMPECGGCRTCEMACSFHHTKKFTPSISSLKVIDKEEGPGYRVVLVAKKIHERIACDGCKDLNVPLCVAHCKENDDLMDILIRFEKRINQKK
jgi:Fe-S-cluster-containing dehydrogenase component